MDGGEDAVAQTGEAGGVGGDPERALAVLVEGGDGVSAEAAEWVQAVGVVVEASAFEAAEAAEGSDPERAGAGAQDGADDVGAEAVAVGVDGDGGAAVGGLAGLRCARPLRVPIQRVPSVSA